VNPYTQLPENTPRLDWMVWDFDTKGQKLSEKDIQHEYAYGPPVKLCGDPDTRPREGRAVGLTILHDPPIGPATDAYFDTVLSTLQGLPAGTAQPSTRSLADLNGDGTVDMKDFAAFQAAFGSCVGRTNYLTAADLDADGCVTLKDYQIWLSLYNNAKH